MEREGLISHVQEYSNHIVQQWSDLRLTPKIQGCSLCLAAILVYARVNGRKKTGASPAWQQKNMVERNERREIMTVYERRTGDVSDR